MGLYLLMLGGIYSHFIQGMPLIGNRCRSHLWDTYLSGEKGSYDHHEPNKIGSSLHRLHVGVHKALSPIEVIGSGKYAVYGESCCCESVNGIHEATTLMSMEGTGEIRQLCPSTEIDLYISLGQTCMLTGRTMVKTGSCYI